MKSAAYQASFVAATGEGDVETAVRQAKAYCSEAYFTVAAENMRIAERLGL